MTGDPDWANVVFLSGFEGGSIVDESSLAQTVTLIGGAAASATQAKFGTKSFLPGTDFATVPYNAAFLTNAASYTIEGWFYWPAGTITGGTKVLLSHGNFATDSAWYLDYSAASVRLGFSFYRFAASSGATDAVRCLTWTPTADTWHHIALDFDQPTGTFRLYVDGVTKAIDTSFLSMYAAATAPLCLGAKDNGGAAFTPFPGYIDEARITAGVARYNNDTGFTPLVAAFERGAFSDLDALAEDGVVMSGESGLGDVFSDVLADGIGTHLVTLLTLPATSTNGIGITPVPAVVRTQPATATGGIGAHDALTPARGQVLLEQLHIALSQIDNYKSHLTITSGVGLLAQLAQARPVTLTSGVGVAMTQQAQLSIQIIEELGLLPAFAPILIYKRSLSDAIGIADELSRFLGAHLSDGIGVAPTQVVVAGKGGLISEGIGIQAVLSPRLILRVTAADTIDIADADVLKMLYKPVLAEGIQLSAAYVAPNGSVTTWAMNTRTGAVTEYSNYDFNSFAKLGDRYVGASQSGLYELIGDDDAGTDIVASIKSGFAQWAGSHFTMFKGLYIGVRGEGDYVLRMTTGDGKTYNYAVAARDMRTTKVHVGKGLRARYFAFELISTGQDFDLDTIEFVPIAVDRRV